MCLSSWFVSVHWYDTVADRSQYVVYPRRNSPDLLFVLSRPRWRHWLSWLLPQRDARLPSNTVGRQQRLEPICRYETLTKHVTSRSKNIFKSFKKATFTANLLLRRGISQAAATQLRNMFRCFYRDWGVEFAGTRWTYSGYGYGHVKTGCLRNGIALY